MVVVSNSFDETITNLIIKNQKSLKCDISIVLLSELLFDYEIFDELSDSKKIVTWFINNNKQISNLTHSILNRVLYIPNEIFSKFKSEDYEYAQREFEAYIGFAFNAYYGVSNKTTNGLCENLISLPQQWNIVKKICNVNTPAFYWGPSQLNYLTKEANSIYSNIYNLLNWSPSNNIPDNEHIFCFLKPLGEPIFVLSIGQKKLITTDITLPSEIEKTLNNIVDKITDAICYFISEMLFFFDGNNLTFGCINSAVIKSGKNKNIDNFICNNLIEEFKRCAN